MDKLLIAKSAAQSDSEPTDDILSLIERYAVKTPQKEDIFVFNVILCDNEVDRDHERFSIDSLRRLAMLFEGVTGIFDHNMKAENQTARIFKTEVITDEQHKTSQGEPYTCVKASCYMLKNDKNASLISEIEAGIKKEVSVSCAVSRKICSICGKDMNTSECIHIPGKAYGSEICHAILSEPTDAYEWSFVAVPAQRRAGVSKSAKKTKTAIKTDLCVSGESADEIIKNAFAAGSAVSLSKTQLDTLQKYLNAVNDDVQAAKTKRAETEKDIIALSALTIPDMDTAMLAVILKKLANDEILMLQKAFADHAHSVKLCTPKLSGENVNCPSGNEQFKI